MKPLLGARHLLAILDKWLLSVKAVTPAVKKANRFP